MNWRSAITGFKSYILLERSMSANSISAYLADVEKLASFCINNLAIQNVHQVQHKDIESFLACIHDLGLNQRSQARILSGIRTFYKYLILEDIVINDPVELIESPKLPKKIPDVLTKEDIDKIIEAIDLSHPQGHRNKAIIETLYGCGLRATELTELKISNIFRDLSYLRVIGKNNKERLIPIAAYTLKQIDYYLDFDRKEGKIQEGYDDFVFLNRRGKKLTRVMIFTIVKNLVQKAGIQKTISPHTFRHSFATHLVESGADLRAVQEMLGHESILTTEIYTHLNTKFLRDTLYKYHPMAR